MKLVIHHDPQQAPDARLAYPTAMRHYARAIAYAVDGIRVIEILRSNELTAAVPIIAWCSLPIDIARTSRSTSPAPIFLPLEAT